jgi:hypothetical protein
MTKNQIDFWNYLETARHNQAYEQETHRHNSVTEHQTDLAFVETKAQNAFIRDLERNKLQATYDKMRLDKNIAEANLQYNYARLNQDWQVSAAQRDLQWQVAQLQSRTSLQTSEMSAAASRYAADMGYAGRKYATDVQARVSENNAKLQAETNRIINMTKIRNQGLWEYNRNQLNRQIAELQSESNFKIAQLKQQSTERIADANRKTQVDIANAQINRDYNVSEYRGKIAMGQSGVGLISSIIGKLNFGGTKSIKMSTEREEFE